MTSPRDPAAGLYGDCETLDEARRILDQTNRDYYARSQRQMAYTLTYEWNDTGSCICGAELATHTEAITHFAGEKGSKIHQPLKRTATSNKVASGFMCATPHGTRCPACDVATTGAETKRLHRRQGLDATNLGRE